MCRLAIVILNWNGVEMLRSYLPSVVRSSQGEGIDVIVADNGSTDGSLQMLAEEFPDVRQIPLDHNYGFAEGYNQALKQVEAQYYMLLNSDVELRQAECLQPMLHYMDNHPGCAACQPKLLSLLHPEKFEYAGAAGGYIDRYGYPYCRGRIFDTVEDDRGQYDKIVPLHWATGAALMVRADLYWQVGGLDGSFFAHMEEIDLCWRLRRAGYQIVCVSQSKAYHLGGATLNQGNPRKTYLNFRNNIKMLRKNLPSNESRKVLLMRAVLDTVAAMKFILTGDVQNAKAIRQAWKDALDKSQSPLPVPPKGKDEHQQNNENRSIEGDIEGVSSTFLLWQYYFLRHKTYSQLKK